MPVLRDIEIWRGNDRPAIVWPWPEGYTASATCRLTIWFKDAVLIDAASGGGAFEIDATARRFVWSRTVAESRMIPLGRGAAYEIEDQGSGEETIFAGVVAGLGGLNLDRDPPPPGGALDFALAQNSDQEPEGWI